ncbi:hypothetical protein VP01_179g8 [Puccinia sorghi]|uniref:Uncharacterized protein n=1 Tax=Puccinia sorghi TaxID=27349 RepID=A0A0L6VEB3_9BASI|nr:hypothetical protein VP01_179g8 [Puccinia sorghi]
MMHLSNVLIIVLITVLSVLTARADFSCKDKGSARNRQATLGYCMRPIDWREYRNPTVGRNLKGKHRLMTIATWVSPGVYTCKRSRGPRGIIPVNVKIDYIDATEAYCCPPRNHQQSKPVGIG